MPRAPSGFVGIAVSIFVGAVLISRTTEAVAGAVRTGDGQRVSAHQQRLNLLGTIDLAVVFTVVAAMVHDPG